MVLPINFVSATNIEELFFYEGQTISDGNVFWYSQTNPTIPKSVYSQTSLLPLPNPTAIVNGKLVNEFGDSVKPIYRLTDDEGNSELYFVQVRLNDNFTPETGTLVETRENWPPVTITGSSEALTNLENFAINGQFRWNTTPSEQVAGLTGLIQQSVTPIAAGNWLFVRDDTSTATDYVTFFRYPQYVGDPLQSPRYAVQIATTAPDSNDVRKDLVLQYNDVNKFSSDTQIYTYAFQAQTLDGSTRPVTLFLRRNFGTGGTVSPDEEVLLASFMINDQLSIYQIQFIPGIPTGTLIGTNDDDYVQIGLRFETNIVQSYQMTNFAMFAGELVISDFPITTSRDFLVRSSFLDEEEVGNYNLYLKPIRTPRGFEFDYGEIGRIETRSYPSQRPFFDPDTNLMFCAGQSIKIDSYSPLGVPMRRLWERGIYNATLGVNNFGNGSAFISTGVENPASVNYTFVSPNQVANAVPVNAGTSPFTFNLVSGGFASNFNYNVFYGSLNSAAQSSTVNFIGVSNLISATPVPTPTVGTVPGLSLFVKSLLGIPEFVFYFTNAAVGMEGTYFQFTDASLTLYYCWYQVNGVGVDPAPGGIGILVNLPTGSTAPQIAIATAQTLRGHPCSRVLYTNGASVSGGNYWTFDTYAPSTAGNFYVWYTVDGAGVDPALANRTGIQVNINSGNTDQQVQATTHAALNAVYYAVPDYRGIFLRGDGNVLYDQDTRFSYSDVSPAILQGSFQMQDLSYHNHISNIRTTLLSNANPGANLIGGTGINSNQPTTFTGGTGTRPTNAAVSYYIRY